MIDDWSDKTELQRRLDGDAQTGYPTRPQVKSKPQAYPLGYIEDFAEPRTQLGACFSIPLKEGHAR